MEPAFDLHLPRHIRFGRDAAAHAVEAVCARGKRPLLIHGANPRRSQWLIDALIAANCPPTRHACPHEPDVALIEAGVVAGRHDDVDVVIGLGGGSVIDTAKAVAGLIPASGDVVDYLEVVGDNAPLDATPLPFIALPTTAGTGTEATYNSVIDVPSARRKVSLRDPRLLPDVAIVDPALTDNTPAAVTLASGLDAITQVIEPFISCRANRFTDALCRDAIPQGLAALRTLMATEDSTARDTMAWVSLSGGLALANAKLGAVHGLAGPLGGVTDMPHGAIAGALLPEALRANREATRGRIAGRIVEVERWIAEAFGCEAEVAIDRLAAWSRAQGLPGLREAGLDPAELPPIAAAAEQSSSMQGNPVVLPADRLVQMMEQAW
ncbi:iron-containing alcohol dehydrogenase [Spiribacter vilamensis]|uniref:Alcohol dehydrogenase class IV n=1 Tax=Spiribacter vilamensis TaxID=531306 RepID=A0A4Q8CZ11_9GAMM|nr:iron-containing alcohol dehydrogenase [Spiribacter vilamensis]RZU98241.1 alcohol dehydrogenase class IV [Spiribacter vilamensis]TVO60860.1 iron-containing alcohol dehydrogenase [Spiribacter vilamensis]